MKPKLKWAAVTVSCAGIVAAAFVGGRAWAGGIPAAGALNYSGLLQDGSGAPLSGTQYVEVKFWNDATASAAANLLCDTGTPTAIGLSNGRFTITLPDKCTTQVGANTGIWAEVIVGPTMDAVASLGRAKLGAVPFAVEANHAVSTDSAATATSAGGALQATILQMQSAIAALQAIKPLTVFYGSSLNTADPPTKSWQSFASACIAADTGGGATILDACLVAAYRKCAGADGLGYQMGWPTGELGSGAVSIVCIK